MYNAISFDDSLTSMKKYLGVTAFHGKFEIANYPVSYNNIKFTTWSSVIGVIEISANFKVQVDAEIAERRITHYGTKEIYANMLISVYLLQELDRANISVLPKHSTELEIKEKAEELASTILSTVPKTASESSAKILKNMYNDVIQLEEALGILSYRGSINSYELKRATFIDSLRDLRDGTIEYSITSKFGVVLDRNTFRTFNSESNSVQFMRLICIVYFLKTGEIKSKDVVNFTKERITKFLSSSK